MADRLTTLRDQDEAERRLADQRLSVSAAVLAAVHAAQGEELLRLRDERLINDRTAMELQLELDEHVHEGAP
jgi:hypothetical protein